ncbi:MAG: alpha/beta hydrolase [Aeriscardovia sp.]|nr:alpha/beta hydrolase [Aeriscardovia sp.]
MEKEVLPALKACKKEGWTPVEGGFRTVPGTRRAAPGEGFVHWSFLDASAFDPALRKVSLQPPLGTVVVSIGFTQSEIRFAELAFYFLEYGLSVLILEHRGHGKSSREIKDPEIVKVSHWRDYERDFAAVMEDAGRKSLLTRPLFLYAHSMGGAIGAGAEEAFPLLFERAVLSSPMMLPKMKLPAFVMEAAAEAMCLIGKGDSKIPESTGFVPPSQAEPLSYRARDEWYFSKRLPCPLLHLSDACCRWSLEALRMDRAIARERSVQKILTPTLIFQAGKDALVDPAAQERFARRARREGVPIWLRRIPGARHEIFCLPPKELGRYLAEVIGFYLSASKANSGCRINS